MIKMMVITSILLISLLQLLQLFFELDYSESSMFNCNLKDKKDYPDDQPQKFE
jgi:hypothetical protein